MLLKLRWWTWRGWPLLGAEAQQVLRNLLIEICEQQSSKFIELQITENAVQAEVATKSDIPVLVQHFKGASSRIMRQRFPELASAGKLWGDGYMAEKIAD